MGTSHLGLVIILTVFLSSNLKADSYRYNILTRNNTTNIISENLKYELHHNDAPIPISFAPFLTALKHQIKSSEHNAIPSKRNKPLLHLSPKTNICTQNRSPTTDAWCNKLIDAIQAMNILKYTRSTGQKNFAKSPDLKLKIISSKPLLTVRPAKFTYKRLKPL